MHTLRVIEGGKNTETLSSTSDWEDFKKELREIEVKIRNFPEDREEERNKKVSLHMGKKNREKLFDLLLFSPWLGVKEIAEELSISERIIAMTLKSGWAAETYCRRGVYTRRGPKFLWAVEGTLPY
jgi:hypothetical protein